MDLSKAFDTLDHELLLFKLSRYNFSNESCLLLRNYLENRYNITCSNGAYSNKKLFKVGVPQGSILGPLLFIIFMNDLCYLDIRSKLIIFADDTTTVQSNNNLKTLMEYISADLDKITVWLKHNKLILNVSKTQALLFNKVHGQYKKKEPDDAEPALKMDNIPILFVNHAKLLGCTISNTLSFEQHTLDLCKTVRSKTYLLKKCSYLFSKDFNATLFKVFIQSRFDYCSSLLLHLSNKVDTERLEKSFNKSFKSLLRVNLLNKPISEQMGMLKHYKILPIKIRMFYHFIIYLFTMIKQNESSFLIKKIFSYKKTAFISNLRKNKRFVLPIFKTKIKEYSFCTLSVKFLDFFLYDHLDKTLQTFKTYLYLHVLEFYLKSLNLFS